jgi:hypothetical protein
MKFTTALKIKALLIVGILLMILFTLLQYYLVNKSYQLTRDKYFKDLAGRATAVLKRPVIASFKTNNTLLLLRLIAVERQVGRDSALMKQFLTKSSPERQRTSRLIRSAFSADTLFSDAAYRFEYQEIIAIVDGRADTLLSVTAKPVIAAGENFPNSKDNQLELADGGNNLTSYLHTSLTGRPEISLQIKATEYLDISKWRHAVKRKMDSVFAATIVMVMACRFCLSWFLLLRLRKKNWRK